ARVARRRRARLARTADADDPRRASIAVFAARSVGCGRVRAHARSVALVGRTRLAVGRACRTLRVDAALILHRARLHARALTIGLGRARVAGMDRARAVVAEVVAVAEVA